MSDAPKKYTAKPSDFGGDFASLAEFTLRQAINAGPELFKKHGRVLVVLQAERDLLKGEMIFRTSWVTQEQLKAPASALLAAASEGKVDTYDPTKETVLVLVQSNGRILPALVRDFERLH